MCRCFLVCGDGRANMSARSSVEAFSASQLVNPSHNDAEFVIGHGLEHRNHLTHDGEFLALLFAGHLAASDAPWIDVFAVAEFPPSRFDQRFAGCNFGKIKHAGPGVVKGAPVGVSFRFPQPWACEKGSSEANDDPSIVSPRDAPGS